MLRTRPSLWRLALTWTPSRAAAEDLLQDCYITAYEALGSGKWDGHAAKTWCRVVLTRRAMRTMRRQHTLSRLLNRLTRRDHWPTTHSQGALDHQQGISEEMQAHLQALPTMQRIALTLQAVEELDVPQIARTIGRSEGAVEQLLVRARRTLRERLDNA